MTNHRNDGESTAESEPASGCSEKGDCRHRLRSRQLLVVRVFQENLATRDCYEMTNNSHPDNNEIVFGIFGDGLLKRLLSSSVGLVWVGGVESIIPVVLRTRPVRTMVGHTFIWVWVWVAIGVKTGHKHTEHNIALVKQWMVIVEISIVVLEGLFPIFVFANLPHFWDNQTEVLWEMESSLLRIVTPRCHHPQMLGITVLWRSIDDKIWSGVPRLTSWHCFRGPPSLSSAMASPSFLFPHDLVLFWEGKTISFEKSSEEEIFQRFSPPRRSDHCPNKTWNPHRLIFWARITSWILCFDSHNMKAYELKTGVQLQCFSIDETIAE